MTILHLLSALPRGAAPPPSPPRYVKVFAAAAVALLAVRSVQASPGTDVGASQPFVRGDVTHGGAGAVSSWTAFHDLGSPLDSAAASQQQIAGKLISLPALFTDHKTHKNAKKEKKEVVLFFNGNQEKDKKQKVQMQVAFCGDKGDQEGTGKVGMTLVEDDPQDSHEGDEKSTTSHTQVAGILISMRDLIQDTILFKHTNSFWLDKIDFTTKIDGDKSLPLMNLGLAVKVATPLLMANEVPRCRVDATFSAQVSSGVAFSNNPGRRLDDELYISERMTGNTFSLPSKLFSNHLGKTVVYVYQRSLLRLLKMFTDVAPLSPSGHVPGLGGSLVSANWMGSYYAGGGHDDQEPTKEHVGTDAIVAAPLPYDNVIVDAKPSRTVPTPFTLDDGTQRLKSINLSGFRGSANFDSSAALAEVDAVQHGILDSFSSIQKHLQDGDKEGAGFALETMIGGADPTFKLNALKDNSGISSQALSDGKSVNFDQVFNNQLGEFIPGHVVDDFVSQTQASLNRPRFSPPSSHEGLPSGHFQQDSSQDASRHFTFGTYNLGKPRSLPSDATEHFHSSTMKNLMHQHTSTAGGSSSRHKLKKITNFENDATVMAKHEIRLDALGGTCRTVCNPNDSTCSCTQLFECVGDMTEYDLVSLTAGGFIDTNVESDTYAAFTIPPEQLNLFNADQGVGAKLRFIKKKADVGNLNHCKSVLEDLFSACDPNEPTCTNPNVQSFAVSVEQVCAVVNTPKKLSFEAIGNEFDSFVDKRIQSPCKPVSYNTCAEYVIEFERLYQGRNTAKYPLKNPMLKGSDLGSCVHWCAEHKRNGVYTSWSERCSWDTRPECAKLPQNNDLVLGHVQFPIRYNFKQDRNTGVVKREFDENPDEHAIKYFYLANQDNKVLGVTPGKCGRWIIGVNDGQSCDEVCQSHGFTCAIRPTTTYDQLRDRLKQAGVDHPVISGYKTASDLNPLDNHHSHSSILQWDKGIWYLGRNDPKCDASKSNARGLCYCETNTPVQVQDPVHSGNNNHQLFSLSDKSQLLSKQCPSMALTNSEASCRHGNELSLSPRVEPLHASQQWTFYRDGGIVNKGCGQWKGHLAISSIEDNSITKIDNTDTIPVSFRNPESDKVMGLASGVSSDVGPVGIRGSATSANGRLVVKGSGADIWDQSDQFQFYHHKSSNRDLEISMLVESFTPLNVWGKGGIMIRESLDQGSKHFSLFLTGNNGLRNQWRPTTNGYSESHGSGDVKDGKLHVKITKRGNVFRAYYKIDSSSDHWVDFGTAQTITFSKDFFVGIAVVSHDNGRTEELKGAEFRTSHTRPNKVTAQSANGSDDQTFHLKRIGGKGKWHVFSKADPAAVLCLEKNECNAGTQIILCDVEDTDIVQWKVKDGKLESAHCEGMVMQIESTSDPNGSNIILAPDNDKGWNQHWNIESNAARLLANDEGPGDAWKAVFVEHNYDFALLPGFPGTRVARTFAWYKEGTFNIQENTWPDASGDNDATLSGSGFNRMKASEHGAIREVVSLSGTTSSKISFGGVIKNKFTICSVTRYTGGANRRILRGKTKDWLHGHWGGRAGVAFYGGWKTSRSNSDSNSVNPRTNWVVMCGANSESTLKLVNGNDVGESGGGTGDDGLTINIGGPYADEVSNFAVAEVMVWDLHLSNEQMEEASSYLMDNLHIGCYSRTDEQDLGFSSARDKDLASMAMRSCDESMSLLLGPTISVGTLRAIATLVSSTEGGHDRMPGECCMDVPTNSDFFGYRYDPKLKDSQNVTMTCKNNGPWHLGISEAACKNAGGEWYRSPCVTLQECIDKRPPRFDLESAHTGSCQDNLQKLNVAFVSTTVTTEVFPLKTHTDCFKFCQSLPDYSLQIGMEVEGDPGSDQGVDTCTCLYNNGRLPSEESLLNHTISSMGQGKFSLKDPTNTMALSLSPGSGCDTAVIGVEVQTFTGSPRQQFQLTHDNRFVSVACPTKVLTTVPSHVQDCSNGATLQANDAIYDQSSNPTTQQWNFENRTIHNVRWSQLAISAIQGYTSSLSSGYFALENPKSHLAIGVVGSSCDNEPMVTLQKTVYGSPNQQFYTSSNNQIVSAMCSGLALGISGDCEPLSALRLMKITRNFTWRINGEDQTIESYQCPGKFIAIATSVATSPTRVNPIQAVQIYNQSLPPTSPASQIKPDFKNRTNVEHTPNTKIAPPRVGAEIILLGTSTELYHLWMQKRQRFQNMRGPFWFLNLDGFAIGVRDGGCAHNMPLETQDDDATSLGQQFYLGPFGSIISAKCPGLAISIETPKVNCTRAAGQSIMLQTYQNEDKQMKWKFTKDGRVESSKCSGVFIDAGKTSGIVLRLGDTSFDNSQKWRRTNVRLLEPVDDGSKQFWTQDWSLSFTDPGYNVSSLPKVSSSAPSDDFICSNIDVTVGPSDQGTKVITVPGLTTDLVCPGIVNKNNWDRETCGMHGSHHCESGDTFEVSVSGTEVTIHRPGTNGWGINLAFTCRMQDGNWITGKDDKSCDQICQSRGQRCDVRLTTKTFAWYKEGTFNIEENTWPDASGDNDATLSGSGLTTTEASGHGATRKLVSLSGTTSSKISFGRVIKNKFTICSVTRYTGGANQRILQGKTKNWLHGHWEGRAGVAHYGTWQTSDSNSVNPKTNWVVMCGANAGSKLKLVNGNDAGTEAGGEGDVELTINIGGAYADEVSNFAVAEVMVWDRVLTDEEMEEASSYLMNKLHEIEKMKLQFTLVGGAMCPDLYKPLTSKWEDCRYAAQSLGFSGDDVANVGYGNSGTWKTSRPRGCFRSAGNGRFHFNTGAGGNFAMGDKILCVKREVKCSSKTAYGLCHCIPDAPAPDVYCYKSNPAFARTFDNFASTFVIKDASDEKKCGAARKEMGFEADHPYDTEVCHKFKEEMCDPFFTGIDHETEALMEPPEFAMVDYDEVEYEEVTYEQPDYVNDPPLKHKAIGALQPTKLNSELQTRATTLKESIARMAAITGEIKDMKNLIKTIDVTKLWCDTVPTVVCAFGCVSFPGPYICKGVCAGLKQVAQLNVKALGTENSILKKSLKPLDPNEALEGYMYSEAAYTDLQDHFDWSHKSLITINSNIDNQHTSMRQHLQDRHFAMETNIGQDITDAQNNIGQLVVNAQNANGEAIVDARNAVSDQHNQMLTFVSSQHNQMFTRIQEIHCKVYEATGGACTRFIGPLEEEQEHAPIELHWPESQPTLVERLQQIWADQHESSMQITLLEMKIDSATTETVKVKAETTKTMTKMMKEMEEMKDDMKEIKEMKDDMKTMKETMKVMQGMMSQVLINSK